MADRRSDVHLEQAEHAEQLAEEAGRRLESARAAAEHYERLASDGGAAQREQHARAAQLYRDAVLIYEAAAVLQTEHAAHERLAAKVPAGGGRTRACLHRPRDSDDPPSRDGRARPRPTGTSPLRGRPRARKPR